MKEPARTFRSVCTVLYHQVCCYTFTFDLLIDTLCIPKPVSVILSEQHEVLLFGSIQEGILQARH